TPSAHIAAVISSPDLGVFAVTAAGSGLRRGHVIYSGVFAVAAVAAAVVCGCCPSFGLLDGFGWECLELGDQFAQGVGVVGKGAVPRELGGGERAGGGLRSWLAA